MAHDMATVFRSGVPATRVIDVRVLHARMLWDNGWGRGRFPNFATYLSTIPRPPRQPSDQRFRHLTLVDTSVRLTDACRMLGIAYGGDNTIFNSFGNVSSGPEVYWMWVQDGRENRGVAPFACTYTFDAHECGLTAFEGVSFFVLHQEVLRHYAIDLAGSRLGSFPAYVACLQMDGEQPTLGVSEYCVGGMHRGTASKWR